MTEAKNPNPFKFGGPVDGDYYLPRAGLARTVRQFLDNQIHVVLVGPRRFGKTSFALQLLKEIEASGQTGVFIDIFNITSHKDFLQQILRALKSKKSLSEKMYEWIKSIPRLSPQISYEQDLLSGNPTFSVSAEISDKDVKDAIQDALAGLGQLGERVVIVIDEFQKITDIQDNGWLEATLRTQMQMLKNTAFLFTGSQESIIQDMLNNQSRPFYRACQTIDFPVFGVEFSDWVIDRFAKVGISCGRQAIDTLRARLQETPNYVQMACFHLVAIGKTNIGLSDVDDVLRTIVKQNSYAYQTLLASLSPLQQRALRLAAIETAPVFSKEMLKKYEIGSGAALASAFRSLKDKQILDEGTGKGKVIFDDPLFSIWLKEEFKQVE